MDKDKVRKKYIDGRITSLEVLLEQIKENNYKTVSQIIGAIHNELETIKQIRKEHE